MCVRPEVVAARHVFRSSLLYGYLSRLATGDHERSDTELRDASSRWFIVQGSIRDYDRSSTRARGQAQHLLRQDMS